MSTINRFTNRSMVVFEKALIRVRADIMMGLQDRTVLQPFFVNIRMLIVNWFKTHLTMQYLFDGYNTIDSLWDQIEVIPDCDLTVILKMRLPHSELYVSQVPDEQRPGFSRLRCDKCKLKKQFEGQPGLLEIICCLFCENDCLSRDKLDKYMITVFQSFMRHYKSTFQTLNKCFKLLYERRGSAHTIHAKNGKAMLSVNFVVALVIGPNSVGAELFALPYPTIGPDNEKNCAFLIWNPMNESHLGRIKGVRYSYALMKSLLTKMELTNFPPIYLTEIFLWCHQRWGHELWDQPLYCVLFNILDQLLEALRLRRIWHSGTKSDNMNWLKTMSHNELRLNIKNVTKTKNGLLRLSQLKKIKVSLLSHYFYMPNYLMNGCFPDEVV